VTLSPPPAIVIAGPTASGKSGLALRMAEEFGGVIVNADSMQVYRGLTIITAGPSDADRARAPHVLYGVLDPATACSAAAWRDMAAAEMERAWAAGKLPVVVGGTGLYLRTLMQGISPVPEIPGDVREAARALLAERGAAAFHGLLAERDPVMAARLDPGNSQRLVRAWEVIEATGRSLAEWQAEPMEGAVSARWFSLALLPPRDALYAAIDGRFRGMVAAGALDEVAALMALNLDPALPAMKALGVPELMAHLRGELALEAAMAAAAQASRNYAKRQMTWFRHQLDASMTASEQLSESLPDKIFPIIRQFLLTGA
jgi:tRNA dimethylallyltransferase